MYTKSDDIRVMFHASVSHRQGCANLPLCQPAPLSPTTELKRNHIKLHPRITLPINVTKFSDVEKEKQGGATALWLYQIDQTFW